jgi:5'-deoxynucleotidase YfbR-like HD superfamily hydrolase
VTTELRDITALRNRAWIPTATGERFFPFEPTRGSIRIEDIAHALACVNRWTGHAPRPYSVAQHSILVSELVPREYALWGLLHDASEAYVADVAGPVKRLPAFDEYRDIEGALETATFEHFNLFGKRPACVKVADLAACATEIRDFFGVAPAAWGYTVDAVDARIVPWSWEHARDRFASRFAQLISDPDVVGSPFRATDSRVDAIAMVRDANLRANTVTRGRIA